LPPLTHPTRTLELNESCKVSQRGQATLPNLFNFKFHLLSAFS
jgi:hypothetical protein